MKRATLTTYSTPPPSGPADITDRLLEREDNQKAAPNRVSPKPRRARSRQAPAEPDLAASRLNTPEVAAPQAPAGLDEALATAEAATDALRQASRTAPARYDVALRYRLDALAHHVQQVKEFVASLTAR
jgi:hypothetical protein